MIPVGIGASALHYGQKYWQRRRKRMTKFSAGKQALRNKAAIRRLQMGHELNTHDFLLSTAPTTTGLISLISGMAQGDTSLTREGLKIQPKHLEWKFQINQHATSTAVPKHTAVRIIIFRDVDQQGIIPTVAMLLEADTITAMPEHDTRPRFKILRDMTFILSGAGQIASFSKGIIKFGKSAQIWYQGSAASIANMGKNNLFMYTVSDDANAPPVALQLRLRFTN